MKENPIHGYYVSPEINVAANLLLKQIERLALSEAKLLTENKDLIAEADIAHKKDLHWEKVYKTSEAANKILTVRPTLAQFNLLQSKIQALEEELEKVEDKNREMQMAGETLQLECNDLQAQLDTANELLRYVYKLPMNEAGNYEENIAWKEAVEQILPESGGKKNKTPRRYLRTCSKCQHNDYMAVMDKVCEKCQAESEAQKTCWLCGGENPDQTITVGRETPGGKKCKQKEVKVHNGCYMDMEP